MNLKHLVDEAKKITEGKYQSTLRDALLEVQEIEKENISCSSLAALPYFSSIELGSVRQKFPMIFPR